MSHSIRYQATKILSRVIAGESLATALPKSAEPLVKELCYGVCRWQPQLELILQQLLRKPIKSRENEIKCLLLIGLYQLQHLGIPSHAAIDETVNTTRELGKEWATGLTNAVLRNYLRQSESLLHKIEQDPQAHHAHPKWLLEALQAAWPEAWQSIVAANNQQAPMWLRVNAMKTSPNEYLKQLNAADIHAISSNDAIDGVLLEKAVKVRDLPGFHQGLVSVQDGAAQLAARLLAPKPSERVLDACAAPGGKCCHLLEIEPKIKEMVAIEIEQRRIELIEQNLERLNLSASLHCADASNPDSWWDGTPFDHILLDAPCSATGVIRRNPDIKLLRKATDIPQLAKQQLKLLTALWPLLKPGGTMLYATCSVLPAENVDVIEKFLKLTPDAKHIMIEAEWGLAQTYGRQILPVPQGMDGFYYCLLTRV